MDFNESFENLKNKAASAAQTAASAAQTAAVKAKNLAQIAKANIDIHAEQEKQKKSYVELGKLFYRDFITDENSDEAEYLPWCEKITASEKKIAELRDLIDSLKSNEKSETPDIADEHEITEDDVDSFMEAEEVCSCDEESKD